MKIYLVRHGESLANVDKAVHFTTPDHAIPLSPEGTHQAERAGNILFDHFMENKEFEWNSKVRIWVSPYKRTRDTASILFESFGRRLGDAKLPSGSFTIDKREHPLLCEQQFGLFDGLEDDELAKRFPAEHAHYALHEKFEGRFWARMPLGESRFDVACRVHQAFGTFHRDAEKHGINTIVVVCHGLVLRAFVMMWCHLSPEWFDGEPNPANCAIRYIDDGEDMGYLW
jgi:broad specificity phosphatase PhoE